MQSVKPQKDMWLKKPTAKDKNCQVIMCNKKQVPLSKDNSCKSTRVYRKSMCSDKNCQENENNVMQSVTKKMDVQLPKPVPYEYRRLCKDKNCQYARCYKSPMRPMYDKSCQLQSESKGTILTLSFSYADSNGNT